MRWNEWFDVIKGKRQLSRVSAYESNEKTRFVKFGKVHVDARVWCLSRQLIIRLNSNMDTRNVMPFYAIIFSD